MNKTLILLCKCRSEFFLELPVHEMEQRLAGLNIDLVTVSDLCSISLAETPFFASIEEKYTNKVVLACHPRAVINLFKQQQISMTNFSVINFRDLGVKRTGDELLKQGLETGAAMVSHVESKIKVPVWFPVVDQERCTACGRCAKFCLFGVYRFEEKKLTVEQPLNCKNNCPACARTCPASAIIFPKIVEGGVIAGAEPAAMKMGVSLAESSLAGRLSERNAVRASILKAGFLKQAESEKQAALKEMILTKNINDDQANI